MKGCLLFPNVSRIFIFKGEHSPQYDYIFVHVVSINSLLNILKFENIVKLSTCVLAHKIFNKSSSIPSLFHDSLRTVSSLHKYNTRYASKGNFQRPKVRTNTGKFAFVYAASELWETVPTNLKRLSINNFKKHYKNHILKCQS